MNAAETDGEWLWKMHNAKGLSYIRTNGNLSKKMPIVKKEKPEGQEN